MDTATRIQQLLGRLDAAAIILTDTTHPDVVVQLDGNGAAAGMEGIVACAITAAEATPAFYAVTLTPTRRHCRQCGTIFDPPQDARALLCPHCAAVPQGATPPVLANPDHEPERPAITAEVAVVAVRPHGV